MAEMMRSMRSAEKYLKSPIEEVSITAKVNTNLEDLLRVYISIY